MAFGFGVSPQDLQWPHLATPMKNVWGAYLWSPIVSYLHAAISA